MELLPTILTDAYLVQPQVFGDRRGWFMETYSKEKMPFPEIVYLQDNHSYSAQKGVVRGLHCQCDPHSQTKLVRCTRGAIYDVIVDVRKGSPTYLKWIKVLLSAENKTQLFVPKGFLHGFVTLTEDTEVQYKVDALYHKPSERTVLWKDPALNIDWGVTDPVLSEKDACAPTLAEAGLDFTYEEKR